MHTPSVLSIYFINNRERERVGRERERGEREGWRERDGWIEGWRDRVMEG